MLAQRDIENEIHAMEIKAGQLEAKLLEGRTAEAKMESDKRDMAALRSKLPVSILSQGHTNDSLMPLIYMAVV